MSRAKLFMTEVIWIVLFMGVAAYPAHSQTRRVPIAYSSLSANQTPLWVAKEEGFFKRYGLDPELVLLEGGTRGAQAVISGDVPVNAMSGQPAISARARGSDLVLIAAVVNKMNYILASAREIKKPEDLKGKRVGITQIGAASYHAVMLALKHWGMDARRDKVTMLQVGNQAARVASLQTGGSDAVIVNPGLGPSLKQHGYNILADFSELPIPYPQSVLLTRDRIIKSDPDLIDRILKGFVMGHVFAVQPRNKERVKAILAKYLRLDSVNKAEEHYNAIVKIMPKKPYVDMTGISSMIEFLAETDPLVARVKAAEVVNHAPLKKLDDAGFIDQLYKQ